MTTWNVADGLTARTRGNGAFPSIGQIGLRPENRVQNKLSRFSDMHRKDGDFCFT